MDEKPEFTFSGCRAPKKNSEHCLVLDYIIVKKKGRTETLDQRNIELAEGTECVREYLSGIFGGIEDVPQFIKELDASKMEKILSKYGGLNGNDINVGLYFCDTGEGGGIKKVYSGSRRFRFP